MSRAPVRLNVTVEGNAVEVFARAAGLDWCPSAWRSYSALSDGSPVEWFTCDHGKWGSETLARKWHEKQQS